MKYLKSLGELANNDVILTILAVLILLLLTSGCGKIDTSGNQTVSLPNTRHDVVVQMDMEMMLNHFYKMCAYDRMNLEDATNALASDVVVPEIEKCAYKRLEKFELMQALSGKK